MRWAQDQVSGFADSTALFGSLPEFDSMAVANFLTALEERLGVLIEDDDARGVAARSGELPGTRPR